MSHLIRLRQGNTVVALSCIDVFSVAVIKFQVSSCNSGLTLVTFHSLSPLSPPTCQHLLEYTFKILFLSQKRQTFSSINFAATFLAVSWFYNKLNYVSDKR